MPDYGTVKWFNDMKGFGFITRDDAVEVFVHHANINGTGRRTLSEGDLVSFTSEAGNKGPEAKNVTRVDGRN